MMELTIWTVAETMFNVVNAVFMYVFLSVFFKKRKQVTNFIKVAVGLVVVLSVTSTILLLDSELIWIIPVLSIANTLLVSFVFFHTKMLGAFIATFLFFVAGASAELISSVIVTAFYEIPTNILIEFNTYRMQSRGLSAIIMVVIIALSKYFRAGKLSLIDTKSLLILCILPFISTIFVQQYSLHIMEEHHNHITADISIILSIIVINIGVFFVLENLLRQYEKNQKLLLMESQNLAQYKHIESLMNAQEHIRTIHHDFRQHVQVMHLMCADERYDELLAYLKKVSNVESETLLINTDNIMLDAVLTSKLEEIKKHNISLTTHFEIDENLEYVDMELCVIVGNGLDNAIEACIRSVNEDKIIEIELIATPKQFLLNVKNTIGDMPKHVDGYLQTQKKDKAMHGIGLKSMKNMCEDLGGNLTYEFDDKYFNLWVAIPFPFAKIK